MSNVYFIKYIENSDRDAIDTVLSKLLLKAGMAADIEQDDLVSVKTHFGEAGNLTALKPWHIKPVVELVKKSGGKPYLTETSVLYKSRRSNAVDHILLAYEHGFTFENTGAPIIMSDGLLGNYEREIEINGDHYERVAIAGDSTASNRMIVCSHATGHLVAGVGAALKNLGMGLTSRKGKLEQHSGVSPSIDSSSCIMCGACFKWCPEDAIEVIDGKASIIKEACIGCGECITVCKPGAVSNSWDGTSEDLQRKMVEHALAIHKSMEGKIFYINYLITMTRDCDCMVNKTPLIDDIGILASSDPVALDSASIELTREANGTSLPELSYPQYDPWIQVNHAQKLGMGSREYTLIEVERP
jgi:uncharacterized Fe-S center protein